MSDLSKSIKKERSERILTFDLLRGYFLCVILINHLQYFPNGLRIVTGDSMLYASTAEGFFVVSGIVLGIVRGRKLLHQPFLTGAKLLWKRAAQLYITTIILTLLFTLIGTLFINNPGLKFGIYTDWENWWQLIWATVTLSYTYGWADFLRMYAIFLFFAPFALWLLRKGLWYIGMTISAIVWALYPLLPEVTLLSQPFSWQFIFLAGLTVGFYWDPITRWWRSLSQQVRRTIGWTTASLFVATALLSLMLVFGHELDGAIGTQLTTIHHGVEQFFNKDRLPVGRILLGTIWFWGLFYIFRRFESSIIKYAGWLLLPFGMNSLYVYTISAVLVFFVHLVIAPPGLPNILLNMLLSLVAVAAVRLALHKKFLMNIIPR